MNRIHILLYMLAGCLLAACGKDSSQITLPAGSIYIQGLSAKDSLVREVGIGKDTFVIVSLKAVLGGQPSGSDHIINFRQDTSKMAIYRAKYGKATLLPADTYFFFRSQCRIPAGASESDSMQLNLVTQTLLKPETVYVLPVTIQSVDGGITAVASGQVFYVVVKTGKRLTISKENWTIVSVTSENSLLGGAAYKAQNLLDNDLNTIWATEYGAPMPQNVVMNLGEAVTFSGITFRTSATYYTSAYGYPTRYKIEVSANGNTWVDKGTYNAGAAPVTQDIGPTTAKFIRFTILDIAPYALSPGLSLLVLSDFGVVR